jgi:hypothetical protein
LIPVTTAAPVKTSVGTVGTVTAPKPTSTLPVGFTGAADIKKAGTWGIVAAGLVAALL